MYVDWILYTWYMCTDRHVMPHMWRSEDNSVESVLSFHLNKVSRYWTPENQASIVNTFNHWAMSLSLNQLPLISNMTGGWPGKNLKWSGHTKHITYFQGMNWALAENSNQEYTNVTTSFSSTIRVKNNRFPFNWILKSLCYFSKQYTMLWIDHNLMKMYFLHKSKISNNDKEKKKQNKGQPHLLLPTALHCILQETTMARAFVEPHVLLDWL